MRVSSTLQPVGLQRFPALVRTIAHAIVLLTCGVIAITSVVAIRHGVFEYFHGNADIVRQLASPLVADEDHTSR
ncbi:hypothetical protein SAMN02745126_05289 [Enhydrobacter aerosaccus]|uniref:Uncharacterized protein n=1 Tax=Enhydrobacter aerosaccus TaxID=225324 RepID=A0A1T4SXJ0_9HYPH|nr:hypothetical protein [Enhydrobacter aerosaccus]SKA32631.1 hypothetical protein SAMN02745126_05289 [Enhydrobacter aerosaccus]